MSVKFKKKSEKLSIPSAPYSDSKAVETSVNNDTAKISLKGRTLTLWSN